MCMLIAKTCFLQCAHGFKKMHIYSVAWFWMGLCATKLECVYTCYYRQQNTVVSY